MTYQIVISKWSEKQSRFIRVASVKCEQYNEAMEISRRMTGKGSPYACTVTDRRPEITSGLYEVAR